MVGKGATRSNLALGFECCLGNVTAFSGLPSAYTPTSLAGEDPRLEISSLCCLQLGLLKGGPFKEKPVARSVGFPVVGDSEACSRHNSLNLGSADAKERNARISKFMAGLKPHLHLTLKALEPSPSAQVMYKLIEIPPSQEAVKPF